MTIKYWRKRIKIPFINISDEFALEIYRFNLRKFARAMAANCLREGDSQDKGRHHEETHMMTTYKSTRMRKALLLGNSDEPKNTKPI